MLHATKRMSWTILALCCLAGVVFSLLASQRTASASTHANSRSTSSAPLSVYTNPGDHSLYALDPTTGAVRWHFTATGNLVQTPTANGNTLYLGSTDGKMYAISKLNGTVVWSKSVTGTVITKVTLGTNGNIYFGTETGSGISTQDFLYALNITTGALVWRDSFDSSHMLDPVNPLEVSNNVIYLIAGTLTALNANNGSVIWTQKGYGDNPTIANGVLYAIFSPNNEGFNSVCALQPSNGSQIWCKQVGATSNTFGVTPFVSNGVIYVTGAADYKLYALNTTDGSQIWSYQAANLINRPTTTSTNVYFTDTTAVYALNISNGSLVWKFIPPASENYPQGRPAVSGNFVYVNGSTFNSPYQNYMATLNAGNGSQARVFTLSDTTVFAPEASPIVS